MTDKKIIFTKHALEQIKRRGLTEAWVSEIIKKHHVALPLQADDTQEFRQERNNTYYYAVVKHRKTVILVITAGETNKP